MNDVTTVRAQGAAQVPSLALSDEELMEVLQGSLYPGAKPASIKLVLGICRASGKDPLKKPYHIVPMYVKPTDGSQSGTRDVIMPGINDYRTDAVRTGQHAGTSEPMFGPDVTRNLGGGEMTFPEWCKVTVRRRLETGEIVEFTAVERWLENYATAGRDTAKPNAMWFKRPYAQLAKCAEAQALRKGFPEVGNQPTAEEMEGKTIDGEYNVVEEKPAIERPKPKDAVGGQIVDAEYSEVEQKGDAPEPQAQDKPAGDKPLASLGMINLIGQKAKQKNIDYATVCERFGFNPKRQPLEGMKGITEEQANEIMLWIKGQ